MKYRIISLFSLFIVALLNCTCLLFAQQQSIFDSLKAELKNEKSDTGKVKLLLTMADRSSRSDTKKAFQYAEQARKIPGQNHDLKYGADILLMESQIYRDNCDYLKSMEKIKKAVEIYRQLRRNDKLADCYLMIGTIHSGREENTKALNYYSKAMHIYKNINASQGMSECYKYMAVIYSRQNDNLKAIEYAKKSVMLAGKNNKLSLAKIYLNMTVYYAGIKNINKALAIQDSIFPVFIEAQDYFGLGQAYNNLACLYIMMEDYKKAKESIFKSLYYSTKFENLQNLINGYVSLSYIYVASNNLDSAIIILRKSLDLNRKLNNIRTFEWLYFEMYSTYVKKGDADKALDYYKKYIKISDSLRNDLTNNMLYEMQTRYEVDIKNDKIQLLEKNEQLARQKIIILGISLCFVIISGIYFFNYRNRKMREKQLRHESELKEAFYKLDTKHRELAYKAVQISQQEQILTQIKSQIRTIKSDSPISKRTIHSVLTGIDQQLKQNTFQDFEKYFIEIHPEFFNRLKQDYVDITQNELKVCALLRLNLSTKQIADVTGKSIRSVECTRTFIRKKMKLTLQDNLFDAISKY